VDSSTQEKLLAIYDRPMVLGENKRRYYLADFLLTNSGSANPLDPVSIKSVLDFALQYDLTSGQFQTLLRNRALFEQVEVFEQQQGSLIERDQ
jgi:hypothetical protein